MDFLFLDGESCLHAHSSKEAFVCVPFSYLSRLPVTHIVFVFVRIWFDCQIG